MHRDVKPENILITRDDQVKVVDFGIAKLTDGISKTDATVAGTLPGITVGTPSYMAPEQFDGALVDGRSDLFSLGCVMFEMASRLSAVWWHNSRRANGRHPSRRGRVARTRPQPSCGAGRHYWPLSDKRPTHRFQSARDLAFSLRAAVQPQPLALDEPVGWQRPRWRNARHRDPLPSSCWRAGS